MAATPTELEQRVADVVFAALKKDEAKGYIVTHDGRQAIVRLFKTFTTYGDAHAAAQEMMRCALYVHKQLVCKSAAVDLMNTFSLIGPPPRRGAPLVTREESRREAARKLISVVPPPSAEEDSPEGVPWWQVLA
jgi:hypothetical protein